jgi:hypothetical protein
VSAIISSVLIAALPRPRMRRMRRTIAVPRCVLTRTNRALLVGLELHLGAGLDPEPPPDREGNR